MSKKKLIFLNLTKFLGDYDYEKYELQFFEKKYSLEIHELIDILYPGNRSDYRYLKCSKKILDFNNLEVWKKHIKKLKLQFKIIIWFQTLPSTFSALKVYTFLKSQKIKIILTHHGSLPSSNMKYNFYQSMLRMPYRLKLLLNNPREIISWYKRFFINFYIKYFDSYLYPDFIITNGLKKYIYYSTKNYNKTKIVSINAWDFSRYYKTKYIKKIINQKYICYLSDGGPNAPGDSSLYGKKRNWSVNNYYRELNEFLKFIQKKFKCEIIISAHPRTSVSFEKKNLKSFKIFYGKTMDIVKHSKFIISPASSSNNYSILFKKPCLFIHSNEVEKNHPQNIAVKKLYAKSVNCKIINISKKDYIKKFKNPKIDYKKYNLFSKTYLKSVNYKNLPNYKIIKQQILNKI